MTQYLALDEVMDGAPPPETLDFLEFCHRGVRVRAYGFLHCITGAPNAAYRSFVARAVEEAPGIVLGEMGLRWAALGIRRELDDYLPIPFRDAAAIGLLMTAHPIVAWSIASGAVIEMLSRRDPTDNGRRGIVEIARSPRFHLLDPWVRRRLAAMPPPETYLRLNMMRRRGDVRVSGPRFPDPAWRWLTAIEPHANIPVRSLHMLEFAVELALAEGADTVSLFVGETHNTDMHWMAHGGLGSIRDDRDRFEAERVIDEARRHARDRAAGRGRFSNLLFSSAIAAGSFPALTAAAVLAA